MKTTLSLIICSLSLAITSCKKDYSSNPQAPLNPTPDKTVHYTDLSNYPITDMRGKSFDIDEDGKMDFYSQMLPVGSAVGDIVKLQFYLYSKIHTSFLNDDQDQSPALSKGDWVKTSYPNHVWWQVSGIVVAQEVTSGNAGTIQWEGAYKNATHKYMPIRVERDGHQYFGWIEISMNQIEKKLILHRAGISKIPNKEIKAGY